MGLGGIACCSSGQIDIAWQFSYVRVEIWFQAYVGRKTHCVRRFHSIELDSDVTELVSGSYVIVCVSAGTRTADHNRARTWVFCVSLPSIATLHVLWWNMSWVRHLENHIRTINILCILYLFFRISCHKRVIPIIHSMCHYSSTLFICSLFYVFCLFLLIHFGGLRLRRWSASCIQGSHDNPCEEQRRYNRSNTAKIWKMFCFLECSQYYGRCKNEPNTIEKNNYIFINNI